MRPSWLPNQLRLMTVRSEGQFNTVVYEEEDLYRAQDRRDIIMLHASESNGSASKSISFVRVHNSVGEMRWQRVRPFDVRPAMPSCTAPRPTCLSPRRRPRIENARVQEHCP